MQVTSTLLKSLYLAAGASVIASPIASPLNRPTQAECVIVKWVVDRLLGIPEAVQFCSSYLQVPTVTETSSMSTTVPTTTTTNTTTTSRPGNHSISAVNNTISSTSVTTYMLSSVKHEVPTTLEARWISKVTSLPTAVATVKHDDLSRACECLSMPKPTVIVTSTLSSAPIANSSAADTTTANSTTTSTITAVSTVTSCLKHHHCGSKISWSPYTSITGPTYSTIKPGHRKTHTRDYPSTISAPEIVTSISVSLYGTSTDFPSGLPFPSQTTGTTTLPPKPEPTTSPPLTVTAPYSYSTGGNYTHFVRAQKPNWLRAA
ncbi:hypothetical protein F4805DRAFT_453835 [Annulohypoxylon moriforme]|nr:hypothetical protein F4805DRAFT_453835 [Annulohypoxylon moriforme]